MQRPNSPLAPPLLKLLAALALGLCLAGTLLSSRAASVLTENEAKALFVINFGRYIDWPAGTFEEPTSALTVCVLGYDSKGLDFSVLAGRFSGRRPVNVRLDTTAASADGCHIAFISDSEERRIALLVKALAERPILTISDVPGFIDRGGAVGLVRDGERLGFEINRAALDRQQLRASAHLLRLARNL